MTRHLAANTQASLRLQGGWDNYMDGLLVTDGTEPITQSPNGHDLILAPSVCEEASPRDHQRGRVYANCRPITDRFCRQLRHDGGLVWGIRFWCFSDGETFQP